MNITDVQKEYVEKCVQQFRDKGIRVDMDLRNEKLGYKIREAQMEKIPFVLVAGEKEIDSSSLNVRLHGGRNLGMQSINDVVELIYEKMDEPFKQGGMSYRYLY